MAGSAAGGSPGQPVDTDRDALLAVHIRCGVAFVLIGGAAIQSRGVWNLAARKGQLDLTFAPSAFPTGYAELWKRADRRQVAGTSATLLVAALEDIHRPKQAASRPNDQAYFRESCPQVLQHIDTKQKTRD